MDKRIQEKRERECFGCTIQELKDNTFMTDWNDPDSILLLSMSIQSDCQELLGFDNAEEQIRQYLNKSKWLINEAKRVQRLKDRIVEGTSYLKGYKDGRNSSPDPQGGSI